MKTENEKFDEAIRLIIIEKKLGKIDITSDEVSFIIELAEQKHYPRAEYILALMYLKGFGLNQNSNLRLDYLEKSSKHSSYDIQIKIAHEYYILGKYDQITKCLERASDDCKWAKSNN